MLIPTFLKFKKELEVLFHFTYYGLNLGESIIYELASYYNIEKPVNKAYLELNSPCKALNKRHSSINC
jgi:predicted transcriptional regulator